MWPEPESFPREDLEASRADKRLQAGSRAAVEEAKRTHAGISCPDCRTDSTLVWFYFSSPAWTWEALCGRAGVVAYCDKHERQVAFVLDLMN